MHIAGAMKKSERKTMHTYGLRDNYGHSDIGIIK